MEYEDSLKGKQKPATCPYLQPDQSSSNHPVIFI